MLEQQNEVKVITSSIIKYFETQKKWEIANLLKIAKASSEVIDYDNWNGGTYTYSFNYYLEIEDFIRVQPWIESYCEEIRKSIDLFTGVLYNEQLGTVKILPICKQYLDWNALSGIATKKDLLQKIELLKNIMTSVSTNGARIQEVEEEYIENYNVLNKWLQALKIDNPNTYTTLWIWYGKWKADLSTYQSRREHIIGIYSELVENVTNSSEEQFALEYKPTGWDRVDRAVYEMKNRLSSAITEEQFQAIGMLGRETIISVAQQVFKKEIHPILDGIDVSDTDAKRMLDAYLSHELSGSSNERTRKFAKSAVDMANHLTHDRTATKRDASLCLVSVTAVASLIKIIDESKS